jgi:hypothetical protein
MQQLQVRYTWKSVLHKLFNVPGVVIVEGIGKVGKTDFSLKISKDLIELPRRAGEPNEPLIKDVASNIDTKGFYPQISDLISIKNWLYSNNHRKLYLFDEANEYLSNLRVMSASNVAFTRLLPQVTKAHARMIVIGHDFGGIDKNVLREAWCKGKFIKTSLKSALLLSNLFSQAIDFHNIEKTSVPFDPYAVAPFTEKPDGVIMFKDSDKETLWKWVNGATIKDLGLHAMQLNRLLRKYVGQTLENDSHASHS